MAKTKADLKAAMEAYANKVTSYSQANRWGFYPTKKGQTYKAGQADCSSSTASFIKWAGYNIDISGTCYTGNMIALTKAAGWTAYTVKEFQKLHGLTADGVLGPKTCAKLALGDIVLNTVHHVEMVYAPGWGGAKITNHKGAPPSTAGGLWCSAKSGTDVGWGRPYQRVGGWTHILVAPADPKPATPAKTVSVAWPAGSPTLWTGVKNTQKTRVTALQKNLKQLGWNPGTIDGDFGANTAAAVKKLQKALGVTADGQYGATTAKKAAAKYPKK